MKRYLVWCPCRLRRLLWGRASARPHDTRSSEGEKFLNLVHQDLVVFGSHGLESGIGQSQDGDIAGDQVIGPGVITIGNGQSVGRCLQQLEGSVAEQGVTDASVEELGAENDVVMFEFATDISALCIVDMLRLLWFEPLPPRYWNCKAGLC